MQSDIRNFQTAEGYSDEQMAEILSARLGRDISPTGYKIVKGRKDAPEDWLRALGIAPTEPTNSGASSSQGASDAPPPGATATAPAGAPTHSLPFEPASARMQLVLIYTMAGKGVALPTRRIGTSDALARANQIETTWAMAAPQIADAYIEWARENATVAHYLGMLTLGGAGGKLILLHGSLIVQTLITSGAIKPEQFMPSAFRVPEETDLIADDDFPDEPEPEPAPKPSGTRSKRS